MHPVSFVLAVSAALLPAAGVAPASGVIPQYQWHTFYNTGVWNWG